MVQLDSDGKRGERFNHDVAIHDTDDLSWASYIIHLYFLRDRHKEPVTTIRKLWKVLDNEREIYASGSRAPR